MDKESLEYIKYIDYIKDISNRMNALHSTILSLHFGLEMENVQQQALDAIQTIGFCIHDISNHLNHELELLEKDEL